MAVQFHQVHRAVSRDARDLVLWIGLRRQRAAREEVPRAAHRVQNGARRGLARRAHADPRGHVAGRAEVPRRGRLPVGLRQDQFRDADSAARVRRLEGDDHRRGHRLDQAGQGRPSLRDQSGGRVFRRRAGDVGEDQLQRDGDAARERHLHQRRADRRWRRLVGRDGAGAGASDRLAGQGLDSGRRQGGAQGGASRMRASRLPPRSAR